MKKMFVIAGVFAFALCAVLLPALASGKADAAPKVKELQPVTEKISVKADRTEAKCGEKITFTVKLTGKNITKRPLLAEIEGNAKIRATRKLVTDENGCAAFEVTSVHPGTVYAAVRIPKTKTFSAAGVAIDKEKVTPALPCPADFNDFWNKIKSGLDARQMDAVLSVEPVRDKSLKAFKVIFPMGGDGKDGYAKLSYPAGAKAKSLPAFLLVHGAGTGFVPVKEAWTKVGGGMLLLSLSPMPADAKGGVYNAKTGRMKGYRYWNADDREKIAFKDMFSRVYRALQYLKSRPEWDGKTLIVYGVSQGGGQALAAGGLDPQISMVVAHVPAICHHGGRARGSDSGWPHYYKIPAYKKDQKAVLDATSYFDGVNFARNIKTQRVMLTTGFIDRVCPSESVFAAFNTIPSANKKLICTPSANHRVPLHVHELALKAVADHIKTGK